MANTSQIGQETYTKTLHSQTPENKSSHSKLHPNLECGKKEKRTYYMEEKQFK